MMTFCSPLSASFAHSEAENLEKLSKLIKDELNASSRKALTRNWWKPASIPESFSCGKLNCSAPKGVLCADLPGLWNHGGEPISSIAFEAYLSELRKGLSEPLIENLIKAFILDNKHASEIHFVPVPD
jgi:Zn-dependent M16 (insulinase) family peptidase